MSAPLPGGLGHLVIDRKPGGSYECPSYVCSRLASLYISETISHDPSSWRWRTRSEWLSLTSISPPPTSFCPSTCRWADTSTTSGVSTRRDVSGGALSVPALKLLSEKRPRRYSTISSPPLLTVPKAFTQSASEV